MMKKWLAMAMAMMMLGAVVTGCGSDTNTSTSGNDTSTSTNEESNTSETPNVDKIKEAGKIVMATNAAFPPFEYISGGEVAGVDADIAAEIAKDLGVELEISDMEFDAIIPAVKNGQADFGAAGMTIRPDRQEQVDFSMEYVKSAQYVIVPKGSGYTADDLADLLIGVQRGTTGDIYCTDEIKQDPNTEEVMRYSNAIVAAQDLMNGKCDAVVIDKLPAESIVSQNSDKLELLAEPLTEESYAIAVKKGNQDLVDAINATLQRLIDEGKIDALVEEHVNNASIDG